MNKIIFFSAIVISTTAFAQNAPPKNSIWVSQDRLAWAVKVGGKSPSCAGVILDKDFKQIGMSIHIYDEKKKVRLGTVILGKAFVQQKQFNKVLVRIDNGPAVKNGEIIDGDSAVVKIENGALAGAKTLEVLLQSTITQKEIPVAFDLSSFPIIEKIQNNNCKLDGIK